MGGLLLLALVSACGLFEAGPIEYVVVKGDTLFVIARDHDVTVDELREWNGLTGDLIEIDQVLLIHTDKPPADIPAAARPKKRKRIAPATVSARPGADEPAPLSMPDPKECLAGPGLDALSEEEQMIGSAGLTTDQVRTAMNGFVGNTLSCITADARYPEEALLMEITVGCDGRVSNVSILDGGDWSAEMAGCVTGVLGYAPFPAHDLPAGEVFQYPLRFTPG